MALRFEVLREDSATGARRGRLHTPHGVVETPAFMPVGTYGAVKGMRAQDLELVGAQIVLANAYHLAERPGSDVVAEVGGLHGFMGWNRPILTDSGGYQVFSLADRCTVDERGVRFRSTLDGSLRSLTPEEVVDVQAQLGVDIAMVLDVCAGNPATRSDAEAAVRRTQAWAERSLAVGGGLPGGLFGIVQGNTYVDLRAAHARELAPMPFDGFAIGGLSVGETKKETWRSLEAAVAELPTDRPRYVMGMGTPEDLVEGVLRGVDLFDCVMPTRHARNGVAFTSTGNVTVRHAAHARDPRPLDPTCGCPTCERYGRAYLRHLMVRREMLAGVLLTLHNVWHYLDTMKRIRHAIESGVVVDLRPSPAVP